MKGDFHVRFLGGWRVVTSSGYPVDKQEEYRRKAMEAAIGKAAGQI